MRERHRWLQPLGTVVALIAVLAVAIGFVLLALGHPPTPAQWAVLGPALAAVVLASLAYPSLRSLIVRSLHQLAGGIRPSLSDIPSALVADLSRSIPLDDALLRLVESLRATLELRAAEVWTVRESRLSLATSDPGRAPRTVALGPGLRAALARTEVRGEAWAHLWVPELLEDRSDGPVAIVPVTHAGTVLGVLVIARSAQSLALTDPETAVLAELSGQLALALHNLELDSALQSSHEALRRRADELRASRARIVAVADAQRRKTERDLHDGAQQRLLSLSMRLAMARSGPVSARASALELAGADLQAAMAELRTLAQGIYPPLLAASGLQEAVPAIVRAAAIPGRAEIRVNRRFGPEVEATVYFCCLEALQNVAKHAGDGAAATVTVHDAGEQLEFVVADDGDGFQPSTSMTGTGLVSMSDRIGAVGGQFEISSAPGKGTSIVGVIPVCEDPLSAPRPRETSAPPSHAG